MTAATTTPAQFRRKAEKAFRNANPIAATIEWTRCERVTWHDGSPGFSGTIKVAAEGFRSREMVATMTSEAVMVR